MLNSIFPINFGWRKILPVTYENFLSETEVLEYIRCKINECIESYNSLITQLPDEVRNIVDDTLTSYKVEIEKSFSNLQNSLSTTNKELLQLSKKVDDNEVRTKEEIKLLQETMLNLYSSTLEDINIFKADINRKLSLIYNDLNALDLRTDIKLKEKSTALIKLMTAKDNALRKDINKKIENIAFDIKVINPSTGELDNLQNVLDYLANLFSKALTCEQYRKLYLTCKEYRELNITCYDYRMYGISNRYSHNQIRDMYGVENEYPFSSVFTSTGSAPPLNNFGLTVDEINKFLEKYTINEIDMQGQYILSNHYNSYLAHSIKLVSDSFTMESDGTSVQMFKIPLRLTDDIESVRSVNLLNENMIASCVCTYPSIDWVTDNCTKYKIQFVNFSYENDTINVNFRLYNPTKTNEVVCVIDVEAICKA